MTGERIERIERIERFDGVATYIERKWGEGAAVGSQAMLEWGQRMVQVRQWRQFSGARRGRKAGEGLSGRR